MVEEDLLTINQVEDKRVQAQVQAQAHLGGAHPLLQEAVTTIEGKVEEEEEVDTKEAPHKITREEMMIRGSTKSMAARTIWTTAPLP